MSMTQLLTLPRKQSSRLSQQHREKEKGSNKNYTSDPQVPTLFPQNSTSHSHLLTLTLATQLSWPFMSTTNPKSSQAKELLSMRIQQRLLQSLSLSPKTDIPGGVSGCQYQTTDDIRHQLRVKNRKLNSRRSPHMPT